MNPYKIRTIVDHIRSQGGLPTDDFGNVLEVKDLIAWFGLGKLLTLEEQLVMKDELRLIAEAQLLAGQLGRFP